MCGSAPRSASARSILLESTYEIDVHARVASYFGPSANISAQGRDDIDVQVRGPTLSAEVKYLMGKRNDYPQIDKDWSGFLLRLTGANNELERNAWVVFLPSIELYRVTDCVSVPKGHGAQYSMRDYAPLCPFAEPIKYKSSETSKLDWRSPIERLQVITMPGGKDVRVDMVGSPKDPLWAMVYTRLVLNTGETVVGAKHWTVDDVPIDPARRAGDDIP
jgi:hypothetical protein